MKYFLVLIAMLVYSQAAHAIGVKATAAITTNATTCLKTDHEGESSYSGIPYHGTIGVKGTWDGATVTWKWGLVAKGASAPAAPEYPIKDKTKVQETSTADDTFTVEFGRPAQKDLYICAVTTGVGTTSIIFELTDN